MSGGYAKLFSTIVTSTIWREDDKTRILWITMLAICDKLGRVAASVPGLAAIANMELPECEAAIDKLSSPDKYSRTKEREGRRIEAVDGGWKILNYGKYRELGRSVERREYLRLKQQESRAKRAASTALSTKSTLSTVSTDINRDQPISEAEADQEDPDLNSGIRDPSVSSQNGRPSGAPARSEEGANASPPWGPSRWKAEYGKAWSAKYGTVAYGMPGDSKACGSLADALEALPVPERLAAQARATKMFGEFLSSADPRTIARRHPFAFFVQEWGGLRVPVKSGGAPNGQKPPPKLPGIEDLSR